MNLKLNAFYWHVILNLYAKAQPVHWNDGMYMQRTVVRIGEFHIWMSFLSVIGKGFEDSGLADILDEAGTVAQKSPTEVMKGRHYNQSVNYKNYGWSFEKETVIYCRQYTECRRKR